MSYYIYKHLDKESETIYIGLTIDMKSRQSSHKSNSHWNKEIHKIEYAEVTDSMLMEIYEKYYIDKYSPKYNIKDIDCQYSRFFTSLEELEFKEYIEVLKPTKDINIKNVKYKKPFYESFEEYYRNSIEILNNFKKEFEKSGSIINNEAYIDNYVVCSFVLRSSVGISAINKIRIRCFETNTYSYDTSSNTLNMNKFNHLKSEEQLKYKSLDELWEEIFI